MDITRLLTVLPILAIVFASACVAPQVPPTPTASILDPSLLPATATVAPATSTAAATATAIPSPSATALPSQTAGPRSPTFIPTPAPTWTLPPPTVTATRVPQTPTATRIPPTPTVIHTPDPVFSRLDRISGVVTWHGVPVSNIPVDLYDDAGVWCGRRPAIAHTQTDGAGRYVFMDVAPGTFWLAFNSNNMDPGLGVVPLYAWVCTARFVKEGPGRTYNMALTKMDLKISFPAPGISFNNPFPTFSWERYPDAAYYTILLDHVTDAYHRLDDDTRVDGLAFVPRAPLAVGKYHLRVYAWDATKARIAFGEVNFAVQ